MAVQIPILDPEVVEPATKRTIAETGYPANIDIAAEALRDASFVATGIIKTVMARK